MAVGDGVVVGEGQGQVSPPPLKYARKPNFVLA